MCINKYHILNKGYRPLDIKTSQFIDVNCGHCIQCQSNRQAGYAYRLQREVFDNPGCMPFFVTFTYSPYYRPVLEYFDDDMNVKSLSVWNRQHLIRMNKVLRRQMEYYFGVHNAFKYLACCERGSNDEYIDDHGRRRIAQACPHIHAMYVVYNIDSLKPIRPLPDRFGEFVFQRNCGFNARSFFHYLLDSRWKYGMIKDLEVTRDVAACTRYVAQYCAKNINENVFDIPLSKIYRLIDRDFADRYENFKNTCLDRINAPFYYDRSRQSFASSLRGHSLFRISDESLSASVLSYLKRSRQPLRSLMMFNSSGVNARRQGQISLLKRHPGPIFFTHLTPRSSQSINIGYSDTPDNNSDLVAKLSSGSLVTLVGTNNASNIPLPFYYYKKLCKSSCIVPDYYRYENYDGRRFHISTAVPQYRKVQCWNNVDGCYIDVRKKVYTMSWFTRIGEYVRHKQYRSKLIRTTKSLRCMLQNRSYFDDLLSKFRSLDKTVQVGMSFLVLSDDLIDRSFTWLSSHIDDLPLKRYFHLSYQELVHLPPDMKYLDCLIKTFSLCRITFSYINQITYRKLFKAKLGRIGLQDPELLLPHFINVNKF